MIDLIKTEFLAFIIRIKLLEKLDYFNNVFSSSYWLVLHDTIDEIPNQLNFYLSDTKGYLLQKYSTTFCNDTPLVRP